MSTQASKAAQHVRRNFRLGPVLASCIALTACGGGGGGGSPISTPAPVPTPAPTPSPSPTPPPSVSFNTAEYRQSEGPAYHNVLPAWSAGATGRDTTIAVIDTGIDTDSPEFAGRLHPASTDVAGNASVEAVDDHGTNVAMIAAAARDGAGILGIAYDADILALRADRPGTCNTGSDALLDGCIFFDSDIARGIDIAVSNGARVVNLSLGGSEPSSALRSAVARAAQAGVVIVIAAGNDGRGDNPDIDPNQPDPFPQGLIDVAGPNLIIVGSINDNGALSDFSNRAGNFGEYFIAARGEEICCVYENGQIQVTVENGQNFVTVFNGTSFSAPQVSGAVALLAQAFPNLTGAQIVELLIDNARDAGATGVDAIYGSGILDIGAAFAPKGTTSLAGTSQVLALDATTLVSSPAMGDALRTHTLVTVITDRYKRAYTVDLAARGQSAAVQPRLRNALEQGARNLGGRDGLLSVAVTVDSRRLAQDPRAGYQPMTLSDSDAMRARVLAASVALRVSPDIQIALGLARSGDGIAAQLAGQDRPAFMIAGTARGDSGFLASSDRAMALRQQFGRVGVTVMAETGEVRWQDREGNRFGETAYNRPQPYARFGVTADQRIGNAAFFAGATWLSEDRTVLGAAFGDLFGATGSDSVFLDVGAGYDLPGKWRITADVRRGMTWANTAGQIAAGSRFSSSAWSLDIGKTAVFQDFDGLAVRVAQPLRVTGGGIGVRLPTAYDYATETPTFSVQQLTLAPTGRERMGEIAWHGWLFGGDANASLYYRTEPGHFKDLPDDVGVAIRWSRNF